MNETQLRADLAALPADLRARLDSAGFDADRLVSLAAPLWARAAGASTTDKDARNRVRGVVEPPKDKDVPDAPVAGTAEHGRLGALGLEAIRRGELALCVMAGGMATRMGGVVKALVEAFDGHTFLDLRLRENAYWSKRAGRPVPLVAHDERRHRRAHPRGPREDRGARPRRDVHAGPRAPPDARRAASFATSRDTPSTYAPGHGDLPDALRRSGLLSAFAGAGGKYVWIANLDNLGATIDPALLGHFIETGADVMVEAAPKVAGDKGGIPVWADAEDAEGHVSRRLQVLEEFRLPKGFDAAAVRVFNTNTFLVRAETAAADEGPLELVRGGEESRRADRRAVRAPPPGAHGGDAGGLRPRASRRSRGALPPGEGPRRARASDGTTSARWPPPAVCSEA